ncbi:MAG: DNA primase [Bacteroidales bacterium]|nr:DNA primase [Bacteroidales bacterium]
MISRETIERIEATARIEEVVGDYIPLKRAGKSFLGVCPFHNDKSPSLHVTPHLGIYKCFACGAAGSPIKFVMEYEKMSYPEALRHLAQKYNIEIVEDKTSTPQQQAERDERASLMAVNEFAEKFFISQLFDTDEGRAVGLSYFKERGFSEATIREFHLGYCPESGFALVTEAKSKGYSLDRLEHLGLIKKSEKGNYYDFYRGRVIFPILNDKGAPVGFGGRDLKYQKGVSKFGKYVNSPENEIYHKREVLYGFYLAKKAISEAQRVYMVEGYTDVISMHQAGMKNVVASSGTALTDGQIRLFSRLTKNITAMFDGDAAGIKAAMRGIELMLPAGLNVKVLQLPAEHDPDTFARSHTDAELKSYLEENSVDFILFKSRILLKNTENDPAARAEVISDIVKNISEIPDAIVQAEYIKQCASLFGYSEEVLNVALRKDAWKNLKKQNSVSNEIAEPRAVTPQTKSVAEQLVQEVDSLAIIEAKILGLMLRYGFFLVKVPDRESDEENSLVTSRIDQYVVNELYAEGLSFSQPIHKQFFEQYTKIVLTAQNQREIINFFVNHQEEAIQKFALSLLDQREPDFSTEWSGRYDVEISTVDNHVGVLSNELMNIVNMFKIRVLESYKKKLMAELNDIENGDETVVNQLLERLAQVNERRRQLSALIGVVITK